MVQHGKKVYKVIYSFHEEKAFHWYVAALSLARSAPLKLIWPELITSRPSLMVYSYTCVQYPPPLKEAQASQFVQV